MRNANGKVALRRTDGDDDRFDGWFSYADIIRSLGESKGFVCFSQKERMIFFRSGLEEEYSSACFMIFFLRIIHSCWFGEWAEVLWPTTAQQNPVLMIYS